MSTFLADYSRIKLAVREVDMADVIDARVYLLSALGAEYLSARPQH